MKYLKCLFPLAILSAVFSAATAQVPVVSLSADFNVPDDGWDKLLQLRNGNTCYLNFSRKSGLIVTMYNSKHELTAVDTTAARLWKADDLESSELDGIFEINGQPVIFIQQLVKNLPVLYRLVLDPVSGKLQQEDKLGELPSVQHRSVLVDDNLASHDFFVEKDPRSDHYAIAAFTGTPIQKNDSLRTRVTVTHYGPQHAVLNKGLFYLADTAYNYFSYINMAVSGDRIYLSTVGFNTKKETGNSVSRVLFSVLSPDSATFSHQLLNTGREPGNVSGAVQYLPALDQVRLLLHIPGQQTDGNSGSEIFQFSASTGKLRKHANLVFPELDRNAQTNLGYQQPFKGTPQRWRTNEDGSSVLLLENLSFFKQGNSQVNKFHTNFGDLGIAMLDSSGRESNTVAISKYQVVTGICEPFQLQRRVKSEWVFRNKIAALNTNTYMSYDFVQIPNASFVLFNDYLQYLETGGAERTRKPLKYPVDANFVCYRFYNGKMDRLFLFGTPETTKGYACLMGAADYDASSKVYATILISRKGLERKANIAWIQF